MLKPKPKQYFLSGEELRNLQLLELEMLVEIDRICRKCDIKYSLIGGTALGAVRHGGFIPWDDDADVGFLRSDYEKFREACQTELDTTRFYFQDYRFTKGYRWGHGKLRRKDTKFTRLNQEDMPYEQGVFVDLFPIDNVPEMRWISPFHNFICFIFRKATYSKIGRTETSGLKKLGYNVLFAIPENRLYAMLDRFVRFNNSGRESKRVRKITFPLPGSGDAYGYLRVWYKELAEIDFEGYRFSIMEDYEGYLSFKYGDYMTLPDEKDRWIHPVSGLKLVDADKEAILRRGLQQRG